MQLHFKIKKPIDQVFETLTDMRKFVAVHPVISKIDNKKDGSYLIHETLKFGFIPFSFTYPATVESLSPDKVIIRAKIMKLTKVEMIFDIKFEDGHSLIKENISFKSILPIKGLMKKIFKEQHEKLFENIENEKF